MNTKRVFYSTEQTEAILGNVPKGHISERIIDLINKGREYERTQERAENYSKYANAVSKEPRDRDSRGLSEVNIMSASLFKDEDDQGDWY